jgi:hypothetical protein
MHTPLARNAIVSRAASTRLSKAALESVAFRSNFYAAILEGRKLETGAEYSESLLARRGGLTTFVKFLRINRRSAACCRQRRDSLPRLTTLVSGSCCDSGWSAGRGSMDAPHEMKSARRVQRGC